MIDLQLSNKPILLFDRRSLPNVDFGQRYWTRVNKITFTCQENAQNDRQDAWMWINITVTYLAR